MLGHELRNPLGAITSAVAVLGARNRSDEAAERAREVIARQAQHLARLVDDLLDVSRVMNGKVVLNRKPVDVGQTVDAVTRTWRSATRLDRHAVTVETSTVWALADEFRIEQVVSNLLDNALKYTPDGGRVTVRAFADGNAAVLEVADTGLGIASDMLDRVFDVFVQGDRTLDRAEGGLGLGLTLVKALVRAHGGSVEARSAGPGEGATFTVRLPRMPAPPRPEAGETAAEPARAPCRVLIVEDNDDVRAMLRSALALAGHEILEAADGLVGIEQAAASRPDVALIDLGLPHLDGYETARRIRARVGAPMMLIALTGYGQAEDRERALAAGFDAHLTKPVSIEDLTAIIDGRIPRPR
jgi:CheY-like chemotaxis protein/two-component sensor histidine kinase